MIKIILCIIIKNESKIIKRLINNVIDFGKVEVRTSKETMNTATIRNISTIPINFTQNTFELPDNNIFTTIAGEAPFTLNPNDTAFMNFSFTPGSVGVTSNILDFYYDNVASPITVEFIGECISNYPLTA